MSSEPWTFFGRFLRSPLSVGAVAPSSRFLAGKMVEAITWKPDVRIVEFGPGTGPFTREILRHLPPTGRYLGIERDPVFCDMLHARFPRIDIVCDSVVQLDELAGARAMLPVDHIVSGLPFASLPPELTKRILDALCAALRPGGTFTTFQYLHAYPLPVARAFRREIERRMGRLSHRAVELRNLPPAFALTWTKAAVPATSHPPQA